MNRKRWTLKTEITDDLLLFREKRKWQMALRRYVLEKKASRAYAFYFGLDIEHFRRWIEIQFTDGLNWQNFGSAWQFYHIVPLGYFDFSDESQLKLCWNFVNIRVERLNDNVDENHIDIITARTYFTSLYTKTGYALCLKMVAKIADVEEQHIKDEPTIEEFLVANKEEVEKISGLDIDEFNNLNQGMSITDILLERQILKKFG